MSLKTYFFCNSALQITSFVSVQEDSSGDGYISCLQVLLALKTIIPEEHLSEEEEIYVYRVGRTHIHT